MKRDKVIKQIRKDYKAWTDPLHHLMGQTVGKKDGYRLTRAALTDSVLNGGLGDLDTLLTKAVDGDPGIDAVLCNWASILLYKLAETKPPPIEWFPKELAMLASAKLHDLANTPSRHRGTNTADFASRDYFIIKRVLYACKELGIKPTRNKSTGHRDSGCSIVAEALKVALNLEERVANEVWGKRSRFGVS